MPNPFSNLLFQDTLPIPSVIDATAGGVFSFETVAAKAQIHSQIQQSAQNNCWTVIQAGAGLPAGALASYLGPLVVAQNGVPIQANWTNNTGAPQTPPPIKVLNHVMVGGAEAVVNQVYTMDPASWAAPKGLSMHLHGGKVKADSDGWPLAETGPGATQNYAYPNDQPANLIWYHDHAMDWTARNVHAGIAGGYLIRDSFDNEIMALIPAANEIPLVFQDRQLWDPAANGGNGALTAEMRYEIASDPNVVGATRSAGYLGAGGTVAVLPEFFGEFNLVNGCLWPKFGALSRDLYRLRMINGANARTYALKLLAKVGGKWRFVNDLLTVIGTDGGLMGSTIPLLPNEELVMAPGERRDVILDLRYLNVDIVNGASQLYWVNVASVPFSSNQASLPSGGTVNALGVKPASVLGGAVNVEDAAFNATLLGFPQIMRFDVDMNLPMQPRSGFLSLKLPDILLRARAANNDFRYMGGLGWRPVPGKAFGCNRVFMIDNNPMPMLAGGQPGSMMFLHECVRLPNNSAAVPNLILRWDADTSTATNPLGARVVNRNVNYQIAGPMPGDPMSSDFKNALTQPAPKPDTYERWYFVNLFDNAAGVPVGQPPLDMHPIHLHLVNFYLSRRWAIGKNGKSVTLTANPGLYASLALRDTQRVRGSETTLNGVNIKSLGEIVELIVYFPQGYGQPSQTGIPLPPVSRYPFHCHILEHEEMGMMRFFDYN